MAVILSIDQGTTGTTSLLLSESGEIVGRGYSEITQFYPKAGWVEHDPEEIFLSVINSVNQAMSAAKLPREAIAGIGITNQRETTVVWERNTGKPVARAIVWQCRRTAPLVNALKQQGYSSLIQDKTGLVLDAYFSGTKLKWLLDQYDPDRKRSGNGELLFGTIDSWLMWKLSGGQIHKTDYTNASRTMLFNIDDLCWDRDLVNLFDIPPQMLPEVMNSSDFYGETDSEIFGARIPITGVAGDQQSALFGQGAWSSGELKNTYGTGCFVMMNTGNHRINSHAGLITTLAANHKGKPVYALEGSVFIGGAVIQYLRDALGLISHAAETDDLVKGTQDNLGVYFVPAFVGLGAPHWNMEVRGMISGLTRGAGKAIIVRSALESIAYQSADVINLMRRESGLPIDELKVDGGAAANQFLMQFQADLLRIPVHIPKILETTALGAALLAGKYLNIWTDQDSRNIIQADRTYVPRQNKSEMEHFYHGWNEAVRLLLNKSDEN